jgi:hypothetical protein
MVNYSMTFQHGFIKCGAQQTLLEAGEPECGIPLKENGNRSFNYLYNALLRNRMLIEMKYEVQICLLGCTAV